MPKIGMSISVVLKACERQIRQSKTQKEFYELSPNRMEHIYKIRCR
ncbi:hypothetical protein HMPREF1987_01961 [Peptostreptococcaceae bacterium oral taxon 113 str. W5053]|nr:hypothetical protein HMPREF1987_01961 [Peptostreptococcaceae bacterium oral taxon 113 str. W5053]